jgi:hypothetical protein
MRHRIVLRIALIALAPIAGLATLSLTIGQTPPAPKPVTPGLPQPFVDPQVKPASANVPSTAGRPTVAAPASTQGPDLAKLPPATRDAYLAAQRGAEWLHRMNLPDGRFVTGWIPALNIPLDGDSFVHQAGATFALAHAAKFFNDERYTLRARQSVLTLMALTRVDPASPGQRTTILPPLVANRMASNGFVLMAMHELPSPAADLLQQGEELCHYIRSRQRGDGSLAVSDDPAVADDPASMRQHAAIALAGLMASQKHRPMPWKTEVVRKALPYYQAQFKAKPSAIMVPWMVVAYSDLFMRTKDSACANFVMEMCDYACTLQYDLTETRHGAWRGGFRDDGESAMLTAPSVVSSALVMAIAEACQVCKVGGADAGRLNRYRSVAAAGATFLTTLQYTESNTLYFSTAYRQVLSGGFHGSHQDGNLRIDYNQHAICALIPYLAYVADR